MVINVGGLWERPTAIADGSEVFPSRYSEINFTEPQRSSFRSSNIEVYSSTEEINLEDSGNANNNDTYSKSVSVTEWPECDETSLHCDGTDSSGLKNNFEEVDAHQGSTDFKGGRRDVCDIADHICAGSGGNICAHASRALRVRSSARKDRHSKVNTAKGLRDRRVRLAVSTALQFYDIQDRLEFDQPSQALDWLLTKAKYAIDQLPKPSTISKMNCSTCSTVSKKSMSISEVISTTRADSNLHSPVGADTRENTASSQECSRLEADHIVRGCRAKARERARERAKEKVSGNNTDGRPSGIQIQSRTSLNPLVSSNCAKNNSGLSSISLQNKNFSSALLNSYMQQEGSDAHLNSANNVESLFLYSSHIADKIPAPPSEPPPLQHNVTSSSFFGNECKSFNRRLVTYIDNLSKSS